MGNSTDHNSASSARTVMLATLFSRLLGFVRQATISAVFGGAGVADVLNAVFNIPNNLRKLLAEGALSSAFIPVLSRVRRQGGDVNLPRQIVRNLLAFQFVVLVPILVICTVFAEPISGTLLAFAEPERQALAADLFQWFVHYTLLISVAAVLVGSLNSADRFLIPAVTPTIFSVSVISSILLLHRYIGVHSMSVGILVGGVGQVLFQAPQFLKLGFDFRLSFGFRNPEFRQIIRRWLPVVASSSIFAVNQQIAIFFATGLSDGSSSALTNAVVFWQLPIGIFGVSIVTVLFPRMSREAGQGDVSALRSTVSFGLRSIIALLLPSSVLLGLIGPELIAVTFQRGRFLPENTLMASQVLAGYCIGMISVSAFNFLQRLHYARGDYRTPALTAVAVVILDVGLSLWLKETVLGVTGLAVANSIGFTAGAMILLLTARRQLAGIDGTAILMTFGRSAVAVLPAAAGLVCLRLFWGDWWVAGSSFPNLLRLLGVGIGSLAVTIGMILAVGEDAATSIIRRRFGGR